MTSLTEPRTTLLDRLCRLRQAEQPEQKAPSVPDVMLAVAHPDDEIIGAGARLPAWSGCRIVYATDGAPRDLRDAVSAGFRTREAYADARRAEAREALALAGVGAGQIHELGFTDQTASLHLAALTRRVAELIRTLQPEVVITHPYEGGHPDHDATAFAVHCACELLLRRENERAPDVLEMTSYHSRDGQIETGEFLGGAECETVTVTLSAEDRLLKRRMLECHRTQAATLKWFTIRNERYRTAPAYDFTTAPHEGRLFYEHFEWGMTGSRWRRLAGEALAELQRGRIR